MTRLIIWRHGNTDWNAEDRVQGHSDIGLNDLGREQAAAAAPLLAALNPDAIIASDLQRAAHTADALAALTGLAVRTDPRLRERNFGLWQGLRRPELDAHYPVEYARWRAGDPSPGCEVESLSDLGKRAGAALTEAADALPGATIVVATHGGTAREVCAELLGWPPAVMRALGSLQNCHWSELVLDPTRGWHPVRGWQLRAHNVGLAAHQHIPAAV